LDLTIVEVSYTGLVTLPEAFAEPQSLCELLFVALRWCWVGETSVTHSRLGLVRAWLSTMRTGL
jgi:hypothetical protein